MNLAWFLDTAGGRTLVLDADPQRSATRWAAAQDGSWGVDVRCVDAERDIAVVSRDIERLAVHGAPPSRTRRDPGRSMGAIIGGAAGRRMESTSGTTTGRGRRIYVSSQA